MQQCIAFFVILDEEKNQTVLPQNSKMTLATYVENLNKRYKLGNATEHTFRGDLQQLIESIVPDIAATNEPKRINCGAPDYVITKKDIPIGYIEAKDIDDKDLSGNKKTGNKEQFDRYKTSLSNIIFTDYLDFQLYIEGEFKTSIRIAEIRNGEIVALTENFAAFTNLIKSFCTYVGQTVKSSKKLAEMMAGKARMLADVITKSLTSDETHNEDSSLKDQMHGFKDILIHDITPKGFADVYAQTIAYGMFAARLHDPTLPTFSRQEAAELIPKTNPFLRKLFGYIAGPDIDDRIVWIVDDLVEIFLACDVSELLKNYGRATGMQDPIIHFYETFLSEYDPALRKARGVWYTPEPVVNFIVRAVDEILKSEFNLSQGLADTSKIKTQSVVETKATADARSKIKQNIVEQEVHRVQILDPATGTGTFLAEVVKHIHKKFEGQRGIWSNYVENHLIPRLNGFELLMASYAMAHLKLDLLLTETGYKPTKNQRFKVFLTNSLEEHHPDTGTLFANWLSTEANEANHIKRDTPVMCVIGNPPYSVSSSNKSEWIEKLTADYKKDLNERNIQPLSDDYIKFIRFGQHFIDKNGSGVLAYISNNSFIDGIIHRQMRKNLLESFDKIYILDLHGNAKKKETAEDGSPDQNVFDIMQGVSINIFVKHGSTTTPAPPLEGGELKKLAEVLHFDLQGKRDLKYDFLNQNHLKSIKWNELQPDAPNFFLVKKDFDQSGDYEKGFKVDELFKVYGMGITTSNDKELIDFVKTNLEIRFPKNSNIEKVNYRLFDERFINYDSKLVERAREKLMGHFLGKENLGLISLKGIRNDLLSKFSITKTIIDKSVISTLDNGYVFPLYLYPEENVTDLFSKVERKPNLNQEIVDKIAEGLGLSFVSEKQKSSPPFKGGAGVVVTEKIQINNLPHLKTFRRTLRNNLTPAEAFLWKYLQNSQLEDRKFRRQHSIGDYILDFYCPSEKLAIELDGAGHFTEAGQLYDQERDAFLAYFGVKVLRFENKFVFENTESVLNEIKNCFGWQYNHPLPPPLQGGEPLANQSFAPIDILDYIYAVLHSPSYREKYKEFLKIDFPRVPYPSDVNTFWQLVKHGSELRQIHLLESSIVENCISPYPEEGSNVVGKLKYENGKVWINDTQFFDNVPETAWNFYIGGYQPAQKWLKDRKERVLGFEDILHYQKIIVALTETDRIMKEIDKINFE